MDSTNQNQQQSEVPMKGLLSDIQRRMLRAHLVRSGVFREGMSDDEIREEQDKLIQAERVEREKVVREKCVEMGIDVGGMDLEQMIEVGRAERDRLKDITEKRAISEKNFASANVPERHRRNIDKSDDHGTGWGRALDRILDRLAGGDGCMIALLGGRGTGKTQLAVSVIHKACGDGMTCRYVKAMDLFREVRRAFAPRARGESAETEADIVDELAELDVLVIDEAHQRGETDWEQNTLINLLDRRYDDLKCTILIANQNRVEFSAAVGDSIVSRMKETGEAIICDWPSFRTPQGAVK